MKNIHILLVEDNEGDIFLTKEALQERKIVNTISVVKNGRDAVDFVFKRGDYNHVETPDLILLDINLPLLSGHEVLYILKTTESTRHIPIIMLTTSSSALDIDISYRQFANCYITKPVEADSFLEAVASIEDFWMSLVVLPPRKLKE